MTINASCNSLIVGIDATNLRSGGGVTHLQELLRFAQPQLHGVERIVVWASLSTLNAIDDKSWLVKKNVHHLNKGLIRRIFWQIFCLSRAARIEGCQVLLVPGGSYAGNFHPVIAISQNLLPFDLVEIRRYGVSFFALKLLLLRLGQTRTFKKADGVLFLSKYAQKAVQSVAGKLSAPVSVVPHGLNPRFLSAPRPQKPIEKYSIMLPYRVIYVSTIDQYKHQWSVVEAIASLREQGFPIALDLIGSAYSPALQKLSNVIERLDPEGILVQYHGAVPFENLNHYYAKADLGIFASSCENMPNILLEMMASGLPIACSSRGPMPEILKHAGVYFDPEQPKEISRAVKELIESPNKRKEKANLAFQISKKYSWNKCSFETLSFITSIAQKYQRDLRSHK
jgi:glycosyltransferase involved in cell wall biosynthesis